MAFFGFDDRGFCHSSNVLRTTKSVYRECSWSKKLGYSAECRANTEGAECQETAQLKWGRFGPARRREKPRKRSARPRLRLNSLHPAAGWALRAFLDFDSPSGKLFIGERIDVLDGEPVIVKRAIAGAHTGRILKASCKPIFCLSRQPQPHFIGSSSMLQLLRNQVAEALTSHSDNGRYPSGLSLRSSSPSACRRRMVSSAADLASFWVG